MSTTQIQVNAILTSQVSPGWKEEKFDGQDRYYVPTIRVNLPELEMPFNLRTDPRFRGHWRPLYDQGPYNTCVANAVAAAFAYERSLQGFPDLDPSRLFLYWNARDIEYQRSDRQRSNPDSTLNSGPNGQGTWIRNAMKVLNKFGVCDDSFWAYDRSKYANKPGQDAYDDASSNIAAEYARIDPDNPDKLASTLSKEDQKTIGDMTLIRLRQCLAEGHPVILGLKIFTKSGPWTVKRDGVWQIVDLPGQGEKPLVAPRGHAVLAIGFDDVKQRICCQNSYGERDEDVPFFYMGYEWIRDFTATRDFWMIRTVTD